MGCYGFTSLTDSVEVIIDGDGGRPDAAFDTELDGLTVNFNNTTPNGDSFEWDFGDGNGSADENPSHTYDMSGEYNVTLIVQNDCGSDTTMLVVVIPAAPGAAFGADMLTGCIPFEVQFMDLSSDDPTMWFWEFEGGDPPTSTGQNPVVTYNHTGNFDVRLVASNAQGQSEIIQTEVIEAIDKPEADFGHQLIGRDVHFSNFSTFIGDVQWSFGDGELSNEVDPVHVYRFPGRYTVTLTVLNECGRDTYTTEIVIPVVIENPDKEEDGDIGLFPNPNGGFMGLVLEFPDYKEGEASIRIMNIFGKIIWEKTLDVQGNFIQEFIELPGAESGAYLLDFRLGNDNYSKKFIIDK